MEHMSEKKAPENKREKEKLIHVTEEQLQAGKAEIMKIVAGLNGAEKLGDLLDKGRKKGRLSSGELMEALEEIDLESEQMDKIYDVLENMGIDTAGEDYLPELSGVEDLLFSLSLSSCLQERLWLARVYLKTLSFS